MLTTDDLALLDFDEAYWPHTGLKELCVEDSFSLTPIGYYERLLELMDDQEAARLLPLRIQELRRHETEYRLALAAHLDSSAELQLGRF